MLTRRELMMAAAAAALAPVPTRAAATSPFLFFSKHLPDLDWADLGRAVKDAGFDGVDLTVRAKGHVAPDRAAADLPKAIDAIRAQGVTVPMVTTELTSASDPLARPLLQAAARSGVRFFKTGYWHYSASPDVRAQVAAVGEALTDSRPSPANAASSSASTITTPTSGPRCGKSRPRWTGSIRNGPATTSIRATRSRKEAAGRGKPPRTWSRSG